MSRHHVPLQVAADHPALPGHFPGSPIVPGVVLLDETLHAIDALAADTEGLPWHIAAVKFHHVVRPGDALQLDFESHPDGPVHFELRSNGTLVASGTVKRRAKIRAVVSTR
jgi:3-hydroxyacyl-[acyl-carrier-protein] dehydratase